MWRGQHGGPGQRWQLQRASACPCGSLVHALPPPTWPPPDFHPHVHPGWELAAAHTLVLVPKGLPSRLQGLLLLLLLLVRLLVVLLQVQEDGRANPEQEVYGVCCMPHSLSSNR